ncbi:MAG: alpha-N-arabinofuranosidase [Halobacteriaceae archaeon]
MTDRIRVDPEADIDEISPHVFGHFAEHLGRCIYGGIWDGDEDAAIEEGIRDDTLSLLQGLDMPNLRWPGGCFADDYHWEDGVGPREERPRRRNVHWVQGRDEEWEESNQFGTDEFLRLCELLDTTPYLAANVGSGDPGEAMDWVEYCNYDGDTELVDRRAENGHEEPYDVPYWGVGNENWGCGGDYEPADYAREFRRYATYLNAFGGNMNPGEKLDLIACGHIAGDWNQEFMKNMAEAGGQNAMDHLSVHRYYNAGDATDFDEDDYYTLLARSLALADDIDQTADTINTYAPAADIGVVVDEWGVWHPEAKNDNGLEQSQTVRDAVSAAGVLDIFANRADVVSMANIAQTVNVLQCLVYTDEDDAWPTQTYQVFDLYEPHMGATAVRSYVETDEREVENERDVPLVSASASRTDDGVFVTLSNRDLDDREVTIDIGLDDPTVAEAEVLFDDADADAEVTKDNADEFAADSLDVDVDAGEVAFDAPGSSVVAIRVE